MAVEMGGEVRVMSTDETGAAVLLVAVEMEAEAWIVTAVEKAAEAVNQHGASAKEPTTVVRLFLVLEEEDVQCQWAPHLPYLPPNAPQSKAQLELPEVPEDVSVALEARCCGR